MPFTRFFLICISAILLIAIGAFPSVAQDAATTQEEAAENSAAETDEDLELLKDLGGELTPNEEKDEDLLEELDEGTTPKDEDDLDLLEALGAETDPSEETKGFVLFKNIGENLRGKIRLTGKHFWQDIDEKRNPEAEDNNDFGEILLGLSTWTGGDRWRIDFLGWAEAGNQEDTWIGGMQWPQDNDYERRHIEVGELYFSLFQTNSDLTLGKKYFKNGVSTLYSPANRYSAYDFHDPLQPKEFGRWQLKLDHYVQDVTLTGAILPVHQSSKFPGSSSRWVVLYDPDEVSESVQDYLDFVNFGDLEFDDFEDITIKTETPDVEFENVSYFGRAKTTFRGYDVFLSGYYGLSSYQVLEKISEDEYVAKYTKVYNLATGFSTTYNKFEFHAEGLYSYSEDSEDDDFLSYVVGMTYKMDDMAKKIFLDQIWVTGEYAGEWLIDEQSADDFVISSEDIRVGTDDIIGRLDFRVNDDLNFEVYLNFELKNDGLFQRYQGTYKFRKGISLTLALDLFSGDEESYYGRWEENNRSVIVLEYVF
jgi:hypothetical protein